jgi:S-DNA-T family DNA segregation ATPase FtsK/SpoIIIE
LLTARWSTVRTPANRSPILVRPLPTSVRLDELPGRRGGLVLGVGGDAATPLWIDPFAGAARLLVAGPARSGRSTTLALILCQARRCGEQVVVLAPARSPLATLARQHALPLLGPDSPASDLGEPR